MGVHRVLTFIPKYMGSFSESSLNVEKNYENSYVYEIATQI